MSGLSLRTVQCNKPTVKRRVQALIPVISNWLGRLQSLNHQVGLIKPTTIQEIRKSKIQKLFVSQLCKFVIHSTSRNKTSLFKQNLKMKCLKTKHFKFQNCCFPLNRHQISSIISNDIFNRISLEKTHG